MKAGLSQQDLADEAGLSLRTISNLEHGRHTPRRLFPLDDEGPAGNGASVKERDAGAHPSG